MLRTLMWIAILGLFALAMPPPWGILWLAVPAAVTVALLVCWRWGRWGVLIPLLLLISTLLATGTFSEWAWWIPVAALTGSWMGLREEGGGPASGQRAWMLLPLLLLAAGLPWALSYPRMVENVNLRLAEGDRDAPELLRRVGLSGERVRLMEQNLPELGVVRSRNVRNALPTILFLWMALLVVAGRDMSSRIAARLHWPALSRARLADWRLPDGAVWVMMAGIGLVLLGHKDWLPTGATLVAVPALGYCVQGIAVVRSLLAVRGVPPSIIVLTLLFVLVMAFPVFLPATVCVGLSDIWLDYRRLEAAPGGDPS